MNSNNKWDRRTGGAGRFWSPPNILSLSRIAAVPFIYWGFAWDGRLGLYLLIACVFLTDAADGYLARRFRWESKWGLVLDPLADKILIGGLAVFLVLFRDFPLWAAALIIARDLAILGAGAYLYLRPGNVVLPADRIGKLTTLTMGAALFLYTAEWQPYGAWALWAALCCVAGSGIHYVLVYVRQVRPQEGRPGGPGGPGRPNRPGGRDGSDGPGGPGVLVASEPDPSETTYRRKTRRERMYT